MKNQYDDIVEKRLGIPPDYQHKALNNSFFLQSNWHSNKLTALDYCLELNEKVCLLDLGVGSGNFELLFAGKLKSITGVDYHKEALDFLDSKLKEAHIKNVRLIHSDIRQLQNVNDIGMYDVVIMVDVIEHIRTKESAELVKLLKTIVNPGGVVCIITPNYRSLWLYIEKVLDRFTIVPHFAGQQHLAQFSSTNLAELFNSGGFTTKTITTFNLFSFIFPFRAISRLLCKFELKSRFGFGNLLLGIFKNGNK